MYFINPDIQCKLFIKSLIKKNEDFISNIQSNIRDNQNVDTKLFK